MKRFISLCLTVILCLSTIMVCSAAEGEVPSAYGDILYKEDFNGSTFNTSDKTVPYWYSAPNLENGVFKSTETNFIVFPAQPAAATGEKLVVEFKFRLDSTSASGNLLEFKMGGNNLILRAHVYAQKLVLNNKADHVVMQLSNAGTWYNMKFIYDPVTGKFDVLRDGECVVRETVYSSAIPNVGMYQIIFQNNTSYDDFKIYSTKNIVSLDFESEKTTSDFYTATVTNSDYVKIVEEDGRKCLLVEQPAESQTSTQLDLNIPPVYSTTGNPYIVYEAKYKNANTTVMTVLADINGTKQGNYYPNTALRASGNYFYVTTGSVNTKILEPYSHEKWHHVQIILDTTTPTAVTFDVWVDGVKKLDDASAKSADIGNITKLSFYSQTGLANKLYIDDIRVYNATEDIIVNMGLSGNTSLNKGGSITITPSVTNSKESAVVNADMEWALVGAPTGVSISDEGVVTATADAQSGVFKIVATASSNGIPFVKEMTARVTDAAHYKLTDYSVTENNISFSVQDLSAENKGLSVIIGIFENDGNCLKEAMMKNAAFENYEWNANISIDDATTGGEKIKVFFWDNNMCPYFTQIEN